MEVISENYADDIKIYYPAEFESDFWKSMVDYFWLDKKSKKGIELIRDSMSRGVKVFKIKYKGEDYYLKKYSYRRLSKKLQNNLLRRPEGIRNLKNSIKLLDAGIPVAKPILSATKRNIISFDSLFFTQKAEGLDFCQYVKRNELSGDKEVLEVLGNMWGKIIGNNFVHQDPGLDNMFIGFSKEEVKMTLIDIDDIYSVRYLPQRVAEHILARFVAKLYINLFRYEKEPLKREDLTFFLSEFVASCDKNFKLEKMTDRVDKLIIKKISKRGWKKIIPCSSVLSDIY